MVINKKEVMNMKTNTIIFGITMMLLLALPAAASDFTLGVFGNANEDDTVNMQDVTYTELIILEYRDETELADAKYDGKINMQDVTQIELVILGKEKEITIFQYIGTPPDVAEEPLTLTMPIERVVTASCYACEALCIFGMEDTVVGVDGFTKKVGEIAELIKDKEEIGQYSSSMDLEKVISLDPDVVIASTYFRSYYPEYEEQLADADIPMLMTDLDEPEKYPEEIEVLGLLMKKQEISKELITFEEELYGRIDEIVSEIPEDDKPKTAYGVYCPCPPGTFLPEEDTGASGAGIRAASDEAPPCYVACAETSGNNRILRSGGINVFGGLTGYQQVDTEAIIGNDPEAFVMDVYPGYAGFVECGYGVEDASSMETVREMFMSSTGWDSTTAVTSGNVYMICNAAGGIHSSIYTLYMAKCLQPDLFSEIDPIEVHGEWLKKFHGLDYTGVYVYPEPETGT